MLQTVSSELLLSLRKYTTAYDMWIYLENIYMQKDYARALLVDQELHALTQGDSTIHEFYAHFQKIWGEYASLMMTKAKTQDHISFLTDILTEKEVITFLTKSRP